MQDEFDRQLENLISKGYPAEAGLSEDGFRNKAAPLREKVDRLKISEPDYLQGILPFVIVVKRELVTADFQMSKVLWQGKSGVVKLTPNLASEYLPVPEVELPQSPIYLLCDIDRGRASLNVRPGDAMKMIIAAARSPLTIEEGIALVTHFPDFLMKNNCYSLLASRKPGDKTVPAIWINGSKSPNLGWCWAGNPHTWLGSASCSSRL